MRFPPDAREFTEQLLDELEKGLLTANFEGQSSLRRVCKRAASDIAAAEEQLRAAEPSLSQPQREFLKEAADKVERVGKIAGGLNATLEFAKKAALLLGPG
jgi:hypothetical protein